MKILFLIFETIFFALSTFLIMEARNICVIDLFLVDTFFLQVSIQFSLFTVTMTAQGLQET